VVVVEVVVVEEEEEVVDSRCIFQPSAHSSASLGFLPCATFC